MIVFALEPAEDAANDARTLAFGLRLQLRLRLGRGARLCFGAARAAMLTRLAGLARRARGAFFHRALGDVRGRLVGDDRLDRGFLPRLDRLVHRVRLGLLVGLLDHLEAGRHVVHLVQLVVAQAVDRVVRRLEVDVRDQQDVDLEARLEFLDLAALLVQEERGHVDRNLHVDRAGVFLHGLFLQDAQDVERGGLDAADMAGAAAARTGDVTRFAERRLQALARKLQQAEAGDLAGLHPGAVVVERLAKAVLHLALVLLRLHVDEVDDDQAAEVTQAELAGDFIGCLEVGARSGFLDVVPFGGARRVDVDGNQRFGMVDDHRAARGQADLPRESRLDLVLDLEAREEGNVVAVELDLLHVAGHHGLHECLCLLVDLLGVDEDFADVGLEIVADRADDEARFQVDQERLRLIAAVFSRRAVVGRDLDGPPKLHEVAHVPLQFLDRAADAGRAGDDAHAMGHFQLVDECPELVAVLALDAARNAAAAGIVRHQDEVASGEADEGGEGRALVAALVLLDLDDELLAFLERVLDARPADLGAFLEVALGDFLEGQEAVPFLAIVDEGGLETGLDPGDYAFIDVALALFPCCGLDVQVDEFLAIDDRDAQFLLLRGVE